MGYEEADLFGSDRVAFDDLQGDLGHTLDRELVDLAPFLVDEVHPLVHRLVTGGVQTAAA